MKKKLLHKDIDFIVNVIWGKIQHHFSFGAQLPMFTVLQRDEGGSS